LRVLIDGNETAIRKKLIYCTFSDKELRAVGLRKSQNRKKTVDKKSSPNHVGPGSLLSD
jgi:hypothetical protein